MHQRGGDEVFAAGLEGLIETQHRGGVCGPFNNCVGKGTAEASEQDITVALGTGGLRAGRRERGR